MHMDSRSPNPSFTQGPKMSWAHVFLIYCMRDKLTSRLLKNLGFLKTHHRNSIEHHNNTEMPVCYKSCNKCLQRAQNSFKMMEKQQSSKPQKNRLMLLTLNIHPSHIRYLGSWIEKAFRILQDPTDTVHAGLGSIRWFGVKTAFRCK